MPTAHVGAVSFDVLQLLPLLLAAGAYARRARALGRRGRPVRTARQAAFFAGIGVMLLALASPVAHLGEELLAAHMVQHLLLADLDG